MSEITEAAVGPLPAPGPYNIIFPSGSASIRMALLTPSTVAKGWDLGIKEGATQIFRESESSILIGFLSEKAKSFIWKPSLFAYSISLISIWFIPSVLIESLLILPPNASSVRIEILSAASCPLTSAVGSNSAKPSFWANCNVASVSYTHLTLPTKA